MRQPCHGETRRHRNEQRSGEGNPSDQLVEDQVPDHAVEEVQRLPTGMTCGMIWKLVFVMLRRESKKRSNTNAPQFVAVVMVPERRLEVARSIVPHVMARVRFLPQEDLSVFSKHARIAGAVE